MSSHPISSFLPQLLVTTNLLSISVDFPIRGISYKQPHYVAFCDYFLLYVFKFYPCCSTYNTYSLLLPDIPLYKYATSCVSIHQLMDICVLNLLVVVPTAETNIHVQGFVGTLFHSSFWYLLMNRIPGSYGNSVS